MVLVQSRVSLALFIPAIGSVVQCVMFCLLVQDMGLVPHWLFCVWYIQPSCSHCLLSCIGCIFLLFGCLFHVCSQVCSCQVKSSSHCLDFGLHIWILKIKLHLYSTSTCHSVDLHYNIMRFACILNLWKKIFFFFSRCLQL